MRRNHEKKLILFIYFLRKKIQILRRCSTILRGRASARLQLLEALPPQPQPHLPPPEFM